METNAATQPRRKKRELTGPSTGTWHMIPLYALKLVREGIQPAESNIVRAPGDAAAILSTYLQDPPQEHFVVMLLNTKNRVIGVNTVYVGSVHTTVLRVAEIFRPAILGNATAIVVSHNHPSGDPTPSPEDIAVTREIVQAGKLLDIEVLDHVVLGEPGRFVSLKERGLGW